jgi:hypothetical protein
MNKRSVWRRTVAIVAALTLAVMMLTGCGLGACTGYSSILNRTYCYDDFTESECEDYDIEEVNGAHWTFYPDEFCSDL